MLVNGFKKYVEEFIQNRIDEVGHLLMNHREYRERSVDLQMKLVDILACIPEEKRQLVMEYEEKELAQLALLIELTYTQGLKDGCYLARRFSN